MFGDLLNFGDGREAEFICLGRRGGLGCLRRTRVLFIVAKLRMMVRIVVKQCYKILSRGCRTIARDEKKCSILSD